jgi:oligoribonuclease (3'-5' exoribonuclease)
MTNWPHADSDCLGLDIRKDRILEIACIITDGKLTKRIEVAFKLNIIGFDATCNAMIC